MRPSVVRSRQRCPRLGRKWSRRFLHLWSWCGLQIFKSAWPGPHLQSASGKVLSLLEACFDLISGSSPSMKIQIMGGKITENLRSKLLAKQTFRCYSVHLLAIAHHIINYWWRKVEHMYLVVLTSTSSKHDSDTKATDNLSFINQSLQFVNRFIRSYSILKAALC